MMRRDADRPTSDRLLVSHGDAHVPVEYFPGPSYLVVLRRCWRPTACIATLALMAYLLLVIPTGPQPTAPDTIALSGTSIHLLVIAGAMLVIVGLRGLPVIIPGLLTPFLLIETRIDTPDHVATWYGQESVLLLVGLTLLVAVIQASRLPELLVVGLWEKHAGHWERLRWQAWTLAYLLGMLLPAPLVWAAHRRSLEILHTQLPPMAPSHRLVTGLRLGILWFSTLGSLGTYFGFHLYVVIAAAGSDSGHPPLTPFQLLLHVGLIGFGLGAAFAALLNWRLHLHGLRADNTVAEHLALERRRIGRINWTRLAILSSVVFGFLLSLARSYTSLVPIVLGLLLILVGLRLVPWRSVRARVVWEYTVLTISFLAIAHGMRATETASALAAAISEPFHVGDWPFWFASMTLVGTLRQFLPVFGVLCVALPIAGPLLPESPYLMLAITVACIRLPDDQGDGWQERARTWGLGLLWWCLWSLLLWGQHVVFFGS